MYIDKLDDLVNKYNNTYHITIKMKPVDVKPSSNKEINYQHPKFKMFQIGLKRFLWLKKIKALFGEHMLSVILKTKKLLEFCTKKIAKNKSKRIEKVIKNKGDKLYVNWKGYESSFNNRIDKRHGIDEWIFSRIKMFGRKS